MHKGLSVNYRKKVLALMFIVSSSLMQASNDDAFKLCLAIMNGLGVRCSMGENRSQVADYENFLKITKNDDILERYSKNRSSDTLYNVSCGLSLGAIVAAGCQCAQLSTGVPYLPETLFVAGYVSSIYYCVGNDNAKKIAASEGSMRYLYTSDY